MTIWKRKISVILIARWYRHGTTLTEKPDGRLMMENAKMSRVYRFRDTVAVSLGNGETAYINPNHARKLARALKRDARSCETERFTESTFGTVEIENEG